MTRPEFYPFHAHYPISKALLKDIKVQSSILTRVWTSFRFMSPRGLKFPSTWSIVRLEMVLRSAKKGKDCVYRGIHGKEDYKINAG